MVEFLHARRWEKRNRIDFYWVMLLVYTFSEYFSVWNLLWISSHFDTWNLCEYLVFGHSSKFFLLIFVGHLPQNMSLKLFKTICLYYVLNSKCANTRISMASLDQTVSISFVNNIYLKIFKTIWHKKVCVKICYNSKSFWI